MYSRLSQVSQQNEQEKHACQEIGFSKILEPVIKVSHKEDTFNLIAPISRKSKALAHPEERHVSHAY